MSAELNAIGLPMAVRNLSLENGLAKIATVSDALALKSDRAKGYNFAAIKGVRDGELSATGKSRRVATAHDSRCNAAYVAQVIHRVSSPSASRSWL
jgi:hypothetical protein